MAQERLGSKDNPELEVHASVVENCVQEALSTHFFQLFQVFHHLLVFGCTSLLDETKLLHEECIFRLAWHCLLNQFSHNLFGCCTFQSLFPPHVIEDLLHEASQIDDNAVTLGQRLEGLEKDCSAEQLD